MLPEGITVEDLLRNNYKSTPRNKVIANFCKDLGLIEKYGSGIRRVINLCKEAGIPLPLITQISGGVNVTFEINKKVTPQATPQVLNLNENVQNLYKLLEEGREYSRDNLMNILNMSDHKYVQNYYIRPLIEAGVLILKYPEKPNHPKQRYLCNTNNNQ